MFLSASELKTHLYKEQIDSISGEDETILVAAIDAAVSEARGYLTAYDTEKALKAVGSSRNALLLLFIKDIAVWHYVNLCNVGTELKLREARYNRAIDWLKSVQKGDVAADLPILEDESGGNPAAGIKFGSNPKRSQHY